MYKHIGGRIDGWIYDGGYRGLVRLKGVEVRVLQDLYGFGTSASPAATTTSTRTTTTATASAAPTATTTSRSTIATEIEAMTMPMELITAEKAPQVSATPYLRPRRRSRIASLSSMWPPVVPGFRATRSS